MLKNLIVNFKIIIVVSQYMPNYSFSEESDKKLAVGKLVCLARTYHKHAKEMNTKVTETPLLFLKPASSVIFTGNSIVMPSISKSVHHEVELCIIISKKCSKVKREDAMNYVLGYCLGLDITARDIQTIAKKNGWPWGIAKGFDTFAPISSVVLKDKIKNPQNLDICLKVNGEVRQSSNTKYMIYTIEEIIEFISSIMTLEPGDMIMTGTPEGVAEIKKGDKLEANLGDICFLNINVK
jgi:2-keto-4-pentenoate hydratase/2-oxohepta-3-ene-1,7-dioic acid hydratase in catechol pathway